MCRNLRHSVSNLGSSVNTLAAISLLILASGCAIEPNPSPLSSDGNGVPTDVFTGPADAATGPADAASQDSVGQDSVGQDSTQDSTAGDGIAPDGGEEDAGPDDAEPLSDAEDRCSRNDVGCLETDAETVAD